MYNALMNQRFGDSRKRQNKVAELSHEGAKLGGTGEGMLFDLTVK
jgi:hypothetical protein